MHVAFQPSTPTTTTGSANAIATHTITGVSGRKHRLMFLSVAFTGGTPAATVNMTVSDGTTTLTIPVAVTGYSQTFMSPFDWALASTVTITVPAAGAGIQAIVSTGSYSETP